ncbi:unnamed protein product [Rotaria sordida]|uniref:Helix-turn-helix domain-containing protein n=2 Tax=Rotaria sordida TaxID=392033 RepID=A0A819D3S8_9BILA|nr:unnamed protein product [Rotaria sordida]
MPLTDTLSNIYIFEWQKLILKNIKQNELFGRSKDGIFFTWNSSNDELHTILETIEKQQPNVRLKIFIGSKVQFLNTCIENRHGQLYTRIYHDPTSQSYALPYVSGHTKVKHSHWLRSALIQAACVCSAVDDFNEERIYLELTCLVNGYSLRFVERHVQHFFDYFNANSMRYSMDQTTYDKFRRQWFDFIVMQDDLTDKMEKLDSTDNLIHLNYFYDFGPRCQFNQQFHDLWDHYFDHHAILSKEKSKIILTTKHFHSLNAFLTQEKSTYQVQL